MPSIQLKKKPLLAFIVALPCLLALGFWQLDRADQKKELIRLQEKRSAEAPVELVENSPDNADNLLYRRLRIVGRYDLVHQFLQDNQVNEGKTGYYVLTPLILENSRKAVLVNRGWLPYSPDRTVLPDISLPAEQVSITGTVSRFSRPGIILEGADIPSKSWPASVQAINTGVLAEKLGYALFDFQLELDKSEQHGFKREWRHPLSMPPEKHIAYAVQWFLLALTLTILFFIYGIRKNNE